jgi:biopolymer transport protein ExbD
MSERLAVRFAARSRRMALTPLVDVVFLLLLFFMLTTTFSRLGEIDLMPAAGGAVAAATPPAFVQLSPERLRVNAVEVPLDTLVARLDTLAETAPEPLVVLVSLSGEPSAQRLVDLLAALRSRPDWQIRVLE